MDKQMSNCSTLIHIHSMFFANSFNNKKFITDLLRVGNTGNDILSILDCIASDYNEFKKSQTQYQLTEPQF